jgi:hypothetical protein
MVHPSIMTRFFVIGDVLCFLIQGGGGGMLSQAKEQSDIDMGNNIILFGLGLQIYIFAFFVKIAGSFHRDLLSHPTIESLEGNFPWKRYMILLYVACACVGIRNTYRIVEYAMGKVCASPTIEYLIDCTRIILILGRQDGYLLSNEWPLYVGDFALMAITLIVCLAWYDPVITKRTAGKKSVEMRLL